MSEPQTSDSELTRLHEAITATIKEGIPQLKHVEACPVLEDGLPLPMLMYAITNMQPGDDPGDGRVCVVATFEACILVEAARHQAPIQAAILATKLVGLLNYQQWGQDFVLPVSDVFAGPTAPIPELAECTAWAVQWRQTIYLGTTQWVWDDDSPSSLVLAPGEEERHELSAG
ncbi:hypothetical protein QIY50_07135 [Pseudomonas putida]|uniref:hypothetical protein n=1 Tax=Pseudomonas putida TaxID=303 RepID=UPI0027A05150|nr:hypothetical protein QIY50_07135 [Pseudomonas putida]